MLMVFPTEAAKRRFEFRQVRQTGVLDSSRLYTQRKLLDLFERSARTSGVLQGRVPEKTELLLRLEEAVESIDFAPGQPLAGLSLSARAGLLDQSIERFAVFAAHEEEVTEWLLAHEPNHKLCGIGQLLQAWRRLCTRTGTADRFVINRALLRLLASGELPEELQTGVCFRAVRWLNPFEEQVAAALKKRIGTGKVRILSALPGAHAEAAEDRLCAAVRSELMRGAEEEWTPWLEDFADAFEADDGNILDPDSKQRVSFFISAHPYGEIEDAARRIAREIELGTPPCEIALVVRDLGPYTDLIPDVFTRFGIPYHFRRGAPASSFPPVKTLLALLRFPQTRCRNRLCDLLLLPGLRWPGLEDPEKSRLAETLRKQAPPVLNRLPRELQQSPVFQEFTNPGGPLTSGEFALKIRLLTEKHGLALPGEVLAIVEEFAAARSRPAPPDRRIALFEKRLDEVTVRDECSTENGVWVINPLDAAGLRFESVLIAGMDDRSFPQIPNTDALLNENERRLLRAFLAERKIPCPRLALSETGAALIQEEILFLTAMGTARKRLTLSCTRTSADGRESAPGEFFERMRSLIGAGKPELGESFHTLLPPELCRAEDEVRQSRAWIAAASAPDRGAVSAAPVLAAGSPAHRALTAWLENNPEFSATALEALARNRLAFFLERVLGAGVDRTHEDRPDPMDRGSLIHTILENIYTENARQSGFFAAPDPSTGRWKLTRIREDQALPLAVFDPDREEDLLVQAGECARSEMARAEQNPDRRLGHPAVWRTEKQKILKIIENFIRIDLGAARSENRFPALFEMKFGAGYGLPLLLKRGDEEIPLKGKIDRVDLLFDGEGRLDRLRVIDYKGASRNDSAGLLETKIALNLDCQLPLYTFAAQQRFFGLHNTPELNEKTEAVYHLQERSLKAMQSQFYNKNKKISMTPERTEAFLETLFLNVRKLRAGDLAAEPLLAGGFNDWSSVCRTATLDPKELASDPN